MNSSATVSLSTLLENWPTYLPHVTSCTQMAAKWPPLSLLWIDVTS